ncbi:MAG: hypothetical protein ACFFD8_09965 [Candidatus Thorarchaeota archaeon]
MNRRIITAILVCIVFSTFVNFLPIANNTTYDSESNIIGELSDQLRILLEDNEVMVDFRAQSSQSPTSIIYVDVMIVYDNRAYNWADIKNLNPAYYFPDVAEKALDYGFGQYWNINFVTRKYADGKWTVYDSNGANYYPNVALMLQRWPYEVTGWSSYRWPIGTQRDRGAHLPAGDTLGHGSYFDLCVLFTNTPNNGYVGAAYILDNVLYINTWYIAGIYSWSYYHWLWGPIRGDQTILMHEAGHCYGVWGDTYGEVMDVMDYYYCQFLPYSHRFSANHQDDIEDNLGRYND